MVNKLHLKYLKRGVDFWNEWRETYPDIRPNLSQANLHNLNLKDVDLSKSNLSQANLKGANLVSANLIRANLLAADLSGAILNGANLTKAYLFSADLSSTDLTETNFSGADLSIAYLSGANLTRANLTQANLSEANLTGAMLYGADLSNAILKSTIMVKTNLENANLMGCSIYGIAAWSVHMQNTNQTKLIITDIDEPTITIDNLKVAQFIHLLINNQEIRDAISTITSKVVLVLGRFTAERKVVLDSLREELLKYDYLPVLFDFEKPGNRGFTETISTIAHLARFIIADLTDPASIPQELQAIIPTLAVPVQPILLEAKREYTMFLDFRKYSWVLPIYLYKDQSSLLISIKEKIIDPSERKLRELETSR